MKAFFKEMDESMAVRFETMEKTFKSVVQGLRNDVDQMKAEMTESRGTIDEINKKVGDIEESLINESEELK